MHKQAQTDPDDDAPKTPYFSSQHSRRRIFRSLNIILIPPCTKIRSLQPCFTALPSPGSWADGLATEIQLQQGITSQISPRGFGRQTDTNCMWRWEWLAAWSEQACLSWTRTPFNYLAWRLLEGIATGEMRISMRISTLLETRWRASGKSPAVHSMPISAHVLTSTVGLSE